MIPALIVPILTGPDMLYRLLDSIDYPVADLVVIDNGRCIPQGKLDRLDKPLWRRVERVHHLRMPSPMGVAPSWNLGIKSLPFAKFWLITGYDTVFAPGSLERFATEMDPASVTLAEVAPRWATFAVGEGAVKQVGLFDEGFHPIYFEDLDYERRCVAAGIPVVHSTIPVGHDNSSTLKAGFDSHNGRTFETNRRYFERKVATNDLSEGRWSLQVRRAQSWD